MKEIENIELANLNPGDYQELKDIMTESYTMMLDSYWEEHQIKQLIKKFAEGMGQLKGMRNCTRPLMKLRFGDWKEEVN